jgi:two-component sensor histidine kinase
MVAAPMQRRKAVPVQNSPTPTSPDPADALPAHDSVAEASHRIANQLGALIYLLDKQRAAVVNGPELVPRAAVAGAIAAVSGKIVAIARLHRRLIAQPDDNEVDVNAALAEILHEFQAIFDQRVQLASSTGEGCRLNSSRFAMLALAFAEIVTNALKHAHPTGLPVEFSLASRLTANGIRLTISDDGVGLPEGFDLERDGGTGLKLVQLLVQSAGGRLALHSSELGLAFAIDLPPDSARGLSPSPDSSAQPSTPRPVRAADGRG